MEFIQKTNAILIKGDLDFNPTHTFMCGQCFRWDAEDDGSYTGVSHGRVVNISSNDEGILIKNTTIDDARDIWVNYLDLNRNYKQIKSGFINDAHLRNAIEFGYGIKILNQEVFECLISFIISTQNGIPRIKKIVSKLCKMYGDKIEYDGKVFYTFPDAQRLKGVTREDLEPLKAGYRADYIVDAVKKVLSNEVDLGKLVSLSTDEARKELIKIKGVGPKVADCVLLFSCGKTDAFPIDVWVQRIMRSLYCRDDSSINFIQAYAKENFGEYAGIAQQYLFYYARENL